MESCHIESLCEIQNIISHPMGIGLGHILRHIEEIHERIPPISNFDVGYEINFSILCS